MKKIGFIILLGSILVLSGCVTTLQKVKEDPQQYVGKVIQIHGDITKVQKIPLIKFSVFLFTETEGASVVVFTSKERSETSGITIKGKVLAVEEDMVNDASSGAVNCLTDFLVDHNFASREKAEKIAVTAMKIVKVLSMKAGSIFFIIEE